MRAIPYLFFGGECGNALDFYRETLGAEVKTVVRFRDMQTGVADMRFDGLHRLGDERLAIVRNHRGHQAATDWLRKLLGGTPNRRQKARLKLALF